MHLLLLAIFSAHAVAPLAPAGVASEPEAPPALALPLAPQGIVGGEPAEDGEFPSVVALYTRNQTFGCTGTLIAPDLVLTAGHCGFSMSGVLVGTHDLATGGTWHEVADVFVHPDYATTYDVAVYRLAVPVEGIEPAPLLLDCDARAALVQGADSWIVGFGDVDRFASESTDLLHAAIATIRDPVCADPANACNPDVSPGGELIAGGDGVDTCNGDSGGPLFVATDEGLFLAGVTSRQARPSTVPCGDGGIYPRTDAFAAWIEETTGLALDWPDCSDVPVDNAPPIVRADPLTVIQNGSARATALHITDEVDQSHVITILTPPPAGRAWVDGDRLVVQPDPFSDEDFVLEIEVADDGEPPLSTTVEVPVEVLGITVLEPPGGCANVPRAPSARWLARRR